VAKRSFDGGIKVKYNHNKSLVNVGRMLRKNMTKEERHLWYDFLRSYSVRFIRQKIIGNYIVDFYCAKANLVIELDGSQHYDEIIKIKDIERTKYLESQGLKVIRIPNNEVNNNFRGVCEFIDSEVEKSFYR
jgi:very-short-patch-repair endonuclease